MRRSRHPHTGFSLIELMITLTLLGILLMLGMPVFSAWITNTQIRTAAESIANGLQVARNEAVRRNAPVRLVKGAGTDSSWTVGCVAAAPGCPDTNAIQFRSAGEGSSGAITVTASDGNTVVFDNFGMRTAPVPGAGTIISFAVDTTSLPSADSRDLRVTVDAGGNVRMCDPNTTAPDPRAC